ncbi:RNA polymerase subunit sigma-24 [Clostridia bacterium]|nr:RNA polymerase subunit sigma-24 [Clostridia bacterium]
MFALHDNDYLVRRAQSGDTEAFEQLMLPLEKRVYSTCYRILGNREDANDCAQDVMLKAFRSIGGYRSQSSLLTWILRITTNLCLDVIRRRKVRSSVSLESLTENGRADEFMNKHHGYHGDFGGDPLDALEQREINQALRVCIDKLPIDMRTVIILRDIQGMSYEAISQVLSLHIGTVKSRINRARERLRQFMREYLEHGDDRPIAKGTVKGTNDTKLRHEKLWEDY